jgi:hypothetical protein
MTRILTAIASAIIFCSCHAVTGSGNIKTQTRHLEQFDGVKTSGSIDVEITNDDKQLVTVEADDNILQYVITDVENGLLTVHLRSNQVYHDINVKVYISTPTLNRLYSSGSGSITARDTLTNEEIKFEASGSSDIDAVVDAPVVSVRSSGSGTIKLRGRTRDLNCRVSGSADVKGSELLSENAEVTVSGSGSAHVFASVSLNAKASGSGDIYYAGNPTRPVIHKSGSGSVRAEK